MLLSVRDVRKAFGPETILSGVSFRLDRREKVALVGRNGTGKTTLLKLLTGEYATDGGSIQCSRGARVGYLRQEAQSAPGRTLLEEAQSSVEERLRLQARLSELEAVLASGKATGDDLDEYSMVHEHVAEAEAFSTERDVRVVLNRMGFEDGEFSRPVEKLSGGERTRLGLARLLLEEPDLLILDEPTNHLDLQATEWLERWVRGYHGAVLLVSHDRTFLEDTAERVLELAEGTITAWPGPFPKYIELKKEAEARQAIVAKRQAAEIAKLDEYVRRFMNSQRTAQARGRLKMMNRLIESQTKAPKRDPGMKAGFGQAKRSGEVVVEAKKLTLGFGDLALMQDFDWTVRFRERWGVVGDNGSGKSTLIKAALGQVPPISGSVRLGAGVVAGYFAQDGETLDPESSPMDVLCWECDLLPEQARNLLGRFLLSGDDVFRPIKTLSGGEKNKLSLARLTVLHPNLLVLDEPTNHLDMDSREALAEVLREYDGTLILVSHDRWLLQQLTDHVLDIRAAGPVVYPGGFGDYRRRSGAALGPVQQNAVPAAETVSEASLSPREVSKEIERLEKQVAEAEARVADREDALRNLEGQLADLPATADVVALSREHASLQEELEGSMGVWAELSAQLERLRLQRA